MKEKLEKELLQYALVLGIVYQIYQSLNSAIQSGFATASIVNITIVLTLLLLLNLAYRSQNTQWLAEVLHLLALCGFLYFWVSSGGLAGTVPSFMCIYFAFIIAISHGAYQLIALGVHIGSLILLIFFPHLLGIENNFDIEKVSVLQRNIDYVVIAIVFMFFAVYLKGQFLAYKSRVATKYSQIHKIAYTLSNQNEELKQQQEELVSINENLEGIIKERMKEIKQKNTDLSEYAFINAHLLRGPLSRIIGLVNLMEHEPELYQNNDLREIKALAIEIDVVVRKINDVVS